MEQTSESLYPSRQTLYLYHLPAKYFIYVSSIVLIVLIALTALIVLIVLISLSLIPDLHRRESRTRIRVLRCGGGR